MRSLLQVFGWGGGRQEDIRVREVPGPTDAEIRFDAIRVDAECAITLADQSAIRIDRELARRGNMADLLLRARDRAGGAEPS